MKVAFLFLDLVRVGRLAIYGHVLRIPLEMEMVEIFVGSFIGKGEV